MANKILVIGAGFSGAVIARELAEFGMSVELIEQRDHLGGNAHDFINEVGIRVHKYGPHLFHTSDLKVVKWLSRFTNWIEYKHKVKALLNNGNYVTLPVNINTIQSVGLENVVDIFYRPYTKKMWGLEIEQIDSSILDRVPVRNDFNEFYFPNDSFQALPLDGYDGLFKSILNHPNIKVYLSTEFEYNMEKSYSHIFNSMPIDLYFDYKFGELPYRSIKFHTHTIPLPKILPVATVNFTNNEPFTRITEWNHFPNSKQISAYSTVTYEEPCDYKDNDFERYYPIKDLNGENIIRYKKYKDMAPSNITFIGRCGMYTYLDMHQAVSTALSIAKKYMSQV